MNNIFREFPDIQNETDILYHIGRFMEQIAEKPDGAVLPNGSQFGHFLKWTNNKWVSSPLPPTINGKDGTKIYFRDGIPELSEENIFNEGDWVVINGSFEIYERNGIAFAPNSNPMAAPAFYFIPKGTIKGSNGNSSFEVLPNTETVTLTAEQANKTLIVLSDSVTTTINTNNVPSGACFMLVNAKNASIYLQRSGQSNASNFLTMANAVYLFVTGGGSELNGYVFKGEKGQDGNNGFVECSKNYFNFGTKTTVSAQARKTNVTPSTSMGGSWDETKYIRNSLELVVNNRPIVVSEYDTVPAGGMLYGLNDYIAYLHVPTGEIYFSSTWEASGSTLYPVDSGRSYVKFLSK